MSGGAVEMAISELLSNAVWACCVLACATLVDRQVTRIISAREEKDLDRRMDGFEERIEGTLKSFEERLGDAIQSANAASVAVGLDPMRERKKPTNRPG